MPEIPEVEAFKYIIEKNCLNKKIDDVQILVTKIIKEISPQNFKKDLIDHKFSEVKRMGKYLVIDLSSSQNKLIMHFGLTGSLVFTKNLKDRVDFSAVNFIFSKAVLHWISIRKFEKLWITKNIDKISGLKDLGPDALTISKNEFLKLAQKYKTKNVKVFFMDQSIISGIGNEYSDEILFQAGIDPHHKIKDLSQKDLEKIYQQIGKVLNYAIKLRIKDIKNLSQEHYGSQQDRTTFSSKYLQAHRHIDMICPKNKNHKLKIAKIGSRSSYYCPVDQK